MLPYAQVVAHGSTRGHRFRPRPFSSVPRDDHTAFFQAWLFFGPIHECLGAPVEEFVDPRSNIITTERLPHWGQRWRKGLPYFSRAKRLAEYNRVQRCLKEACTTLTSLDHVKLRQQGKSNLSEEVAFSIAVLGVTLDQIFTDYDLQTRIGGAEEELRQLSSATTLWPTTELARKRLEAAGGCKSETLRLERYIKATGIYYCGSMQRIGSPVDHSVCQDSGCVAENVVEDKYATAHADDCSDSSTERKGTCEHIGPIVGEVAAILQTDGLPLLELKRDQSSQNTQIKAVQCTGSITYTALSHVWADGMGNPHANTLPQCQINRLHGLLSALNSKKPASIRFWSGRSKTDAVHIWIDTLLIPLEKRLRKKAISRMYDIFKNARHVLVLDKSLLQVSADRPAEELCFRLSAAPWMRRAWTLQEGALANKLYVQFHERAISPAKLAEKAYQRIWKSEPWNLILEECGTVVNFITQSGDEGGEEQLHHVLLGMGQRSTSHPEDKEICFAVMLKMDMEKVLAAEGHRRTLVIVKQMPYIPRSLVWHTQSGLDITGFEWLPQDIISSGGGVSQLGFSLTEQGLAVINEALIFRGRTHYMYKPTQHIRDEHTGKWYLLRWEGDASAMGGRLTQSERTWTAFAALLNRETMFSTLHAVVLRLDWELRSPSSAELLKHADENSTASGKFAGRARIDELDQEVTERLRARTGVKQDQLEEFRQAVRRGESRLEDASEAMVRLYEEEGDDSWYILDGHMKRTSRQWLVK